MNLDSAAKSKQTDEDTVIDLKFLEVALSSYKAMIIKHITDDLETEMEKLFHEIMISEDITFDSIILFAQALLYLGLAVFPHISNMEIEKIHLSESYVVKCGLLLHRDKLHHKVILTFISVYNQLGDSRLILGDHVKSKLFLYNAVQLYLNYTKEEDEYPSPFNIVNNIGLDLEKDTKIILEKLHSQTLATLAKAYKAYCTYKSMQKYMIYQYKSLQKRINFMKEFEENYIIWALEAEILSASLANYDRFTESRNVLATARLMLEKYWDEKCKNADRSESFLTHACYRRGFTSNTAYWAKYGIALLRASKDKLLRDNVCKHHQPDSLRSRVKKSSKEKTTKLLIFSGLEKEIETYIHMITDDYLLNYDSAKVVFVKVLKWLNEAKKNYEQEKQVLQYIDVIQDISRTYKYLACYELNKEKRIKLHKRRIQILEDIFTKTIEPNYIYACLPIWKELAFTYSTLLDIEMENLDFVQLTEKIPMNINYLAKNIVQNFKLYLGN